MKSGILRKGGVAQAVMDAFPSVVFLLDEDLRIHGLNAGASLFAVADVGVGVTQRCGEAIGCVHHRGSLRGCGTMEFCMTCAIRRGVEASLQGKSGFREKWEMTLERQGVAERLSLLVGCSLVKHEDHSLVLVSLEDITAFCRVGRLLTICSNCKRIRNIDNYWMQFEVYLTRFIGIDFTHSLCPRCREELYGHRTK